MATRSPLLGYNHNLKYKGRVYHIQTEDSGESNPHIFTHLFFSGTIIATRKSEYGQLLEIPHYEEKVRQMMQVQHKDVMKSLIKGLFDEKILKYFGKFSDGKEDDDDIVSPLDPLGANLGSSKKPTIPKKAPAPPVVKPPVIPSQSSGKKKIKGTVIAALPIIPGIPRRDPAPIPVTVPHGNQMPGHGQVPAGVSISSKSGRLKEREDSSEFDVTDTQLDDMDWIGKDSQTMPGGISGIGKDFDFVKPPPAVEAPSSVVTSSPPPDIFGGGSGGVVVARPAIILTGENQSFGSFSTKKPKNDDLIRSTSSHVIEPDDDDDDDYTPDKSQRSSQHFYARDDFISELDAAILSDKTNRLTGPIVAPPGLFKPSNSTEIPDHIISIEEVDTKVDDIILDFLRMESKYDGEPD
jgi:hypothetical protein